jgi:hypothetical protein
LPRHGASSSCGWSRWPPDWKVAANILNKQSRTAGKGSPSSLGMGVSLITPVLKSLKNNKKIRILQADKGNYTVVLNESTYKEKISSLQSQRCTIPCLKTLRLKLRGKSGNSSLNTKLFFLLP